MLKELFGVCVILLASSSTERLGSPSKWAPNGIVEGITDCGSSGKLGEVTVTDCTVTPCRFVPDRIYDVTIKFTASVTSSNLKLQIHAAHLWLQFTLDGQIEAGIEYEVKFQLPIDPEWAGVANEVIFYILDFEASIIEVCAQAPIIIG